MITFQFNPFDVEQDSRSFYHSVEIGFPEGQDDDINNIVDKFKVFLLALGYAPSTIEERLYPIDGEGD